MSIEPKYERKAATEYAQKRDRIMGFIYAARELQPLIFELGEKAQSDSEGCMIELTELLQKHNRSLEMLIDYFNLDQSVPSDSILITLLGTELSKLEKSFNFPDGASSLMKEIAATLTTNTVKRKDLSELQKDIAFDADIVACVKTSLFRSSFEFSTVLDALKATDREKSEWQAWFHSTAVALGKDVAFNFDQHGTFRDREILFRECLPICTELALKAWKSHFLDALRVKLSDGTSLYGIDPSSLVDRMPTLIEALDTHNMGYKHHKTTNIEWLKKQIGYSIFGICESYDLQIFNAEANRDIKSLILSRLEISARDAWLSASKRTIVDIQNKIASMSMEEKELWKQKEGANPMPFSVFKEDFKDAWNSAQSLISSVNIDEAELTKKTRASLAQLWGYSDAFCRIKRTT